jgi:hypothetical protein
LSQIAALFVANVSLRVVYALTSDSIGKEIYHVIYFWNTRTRRHHAIFRFQRSLGQPYPVFHRSPHTIYGDSGDDAIDRGYAGDTLVGGLGEDYLTGGAGADMFDFDSVSESPAVPDDCLPDWAAYDTISDFNPLQGDMIDLSSIDANTFVFGDQAFDANQLSFNSFTGVLTADVYGGTDLQVNLQLVRIKTFDGDAGSGSILDGLIA